jgi:cobalt-zinc-cadmium efflux system membrane fusion protein
MPIAAFFLLSAAWKPLHTVGHAIAHAQNNHEQAQEVHAGHERHESMAHKTHENEKKSEDHHGGEKAPMVHMTARQLAEFGIQTAPAGPGEIHIRAELPGEVLPVPDRVAHVVPRVSGFTREVLKNIGDRVSAGEILAVIESRDLADVKSDYLTACRRLELARAHFTREKGLWEQKITSEQEFLDARNALAEVDILVYGATQKLLSLGFERQYIDNLPAHQGSSLTRYHITSPMAGIVTRRDIAVGEVVDTRSDVFVVSDLSEVWVHLTIYQKDLNALATGQAVTIAADKIDAETTGVIDYVSPAVDPATRTATARVVLQNPDGRWRPGLFVSGKVNTAVIPVELAVPKSAIQAMDEEPVVFVRTDHGFAPVHVKTGRRNESCVEIVSGLEPNMEIAVTNTFMLKSELNKEAIGGHHH